MRVNMFSNNFQTILLMLMPYKQCKIKLKLKLGYVGLRLQCTILCPWLTPLLVQVCGGLVYRSSPHRFGHQELSNATSDLVLRSG